MTNSRQSLAFCFSLCGLLSCPPRAVFAQPSSAEIAKGISAYQEHRWTDAMGDFLQALQRDPANPEAHAYVNLLVKQIETQRKAVVHEERLAVLSQASKKLESNRMDTRPFEEAIRETTAAEKRNRQEQKHSQCVMALMEARLGHLAAANDLVLTVLSDDPNNAEAQRMLSALQSQIHETLETDDNLPAHERAVLAGFYAYGQADYRTALAAWTQARSSLQKAFSPEETAHQVALLHFETYEKAAQAHVGEEDRLARAQALFAQGVERYQNGAYAQAQESFRQVALSKPDYPQLGFYLIKSEAEAEKERTRRLSQEKQDRSTEAFAKGLAALERGRYPEARQAFKEVLAQDPTHPRARSYLSVVEMEMSRRHDPHAAELHYETGLICYASGKLEDAEREWSIATRLDPGHQRAANALSKVQKELATYREVPG